MPNMLDMRRRSINNATLAPVFMFNKVSNVCVICYHPFAVYRPRHHCRYAQIHEAVTKEILLRSTDACVDHSLAVRQAMWVPRVRHMLEAQVDARVQLE